MWTSFCWDLALASNSCIVFHAGWIPTFCGALRLRLRADRTLSHALVVLYTVCWTTISMDPNLSSNLVDHIFAVKVHVDNLSPGRSCLICLLVVSISYFHMTHDIYTVHTCIYIYIFMLFIFVEGADLNQQDGIYPQWQPAFLLMSPWPSSWTWSCRWSSVSLLFWLVLHLYAPFKIPTNATILWDAYAYVCI